MEPLHTLGLQGPHTPLSNLASISKFDHNLNSGRACDWLGEQGDSESPDGWTAGGTIDAFKKSKFYF